ncbi:MAG: hypothetical protein GPJ54_08445 [Candidatus Heimdallarchaeota archaeon]|nr:hypothetical protein [Candidatus Heimdallarchaeota archaeon]
MSDDYDASESYYADDVKSKSGSIKKGIGVGIIVTLVFELFVSFVLDAQGNLVHRYIAYMLGIVALFVAAIYSKSTWKMFFLGTPVIVAVSFILPLADSTIFAGLMSPFINLLPTINAINDSLEASGQDVSDLQETLDLLNTYGIILDFVLAIVVGTIASLGLVGFVKIFSKKPNILTIISFIFSLIFFIIGVIILPYILVVSTGVSQFALALGAGGVNLSAGFEIVSGDGDLNEANQFFDEAEKWFDEADEMLTGLEQMQVFALLGASAPDYKVLVDNFLILIDSAVDMAKSIGPMFIGITALQEGMEQSMNVLTTSLANSQLQMSALSTEDEAQFEAGIVKVKQGFGNISKAIPDIQSALLRFNDVNREETLQAADDQGVDVEEQLNLIEGAVNLVNSALDILNILIIDADLNDDFVEEPLVHLLRGAVSLSDASSSVGDNSDFSGTGTTFENIINHLTVVVDTFDDPVFDAFETTDVLNVTELVDLKVELSGMFDFIQDSGNIAISMGEFGLVASPTLLKMNATMKIFKNSDFDQISDSDYDSAIVNFTASDGIITGSAQMRDEGNDIDAQVANMALKSTNEEYGLMSGPATEFVSVFEEFEMGINGQNFFHLSHGFANILGTAKEMKVVQGEVDKIQVENTLLTGLDYATEAAQIDASITRINDSLQVIDTSLELAKINVTQAAGNFSAIGASMPQMATTADALTGTGGIVTNINNIQISISAMIAATSVLPTTVGEFNEKLTVIGDELTKINTELTNVDNNLGSVDVAS